MNIQLNGKIALITASSKGIGFGVARALAGAGARVALCARNQQTLDDAAARLRADAAPAVFTKAGDLGDPGFLKALVLETEEALGGTIDILVNNSGGPPAGGPLSFSDSAWQDALDRNLLSVVRLSTLVVPGMRAKKWGRIVNLTSMAAREPDPGLVLSNVTRAAVSSFAKTLTFEVGPFGITVNTILTGGVLTDRLRSLVERDIAGTGKSLDAVIEDVAKTIPVGRIATPDEFANTILFLVSEEAGYLSGTAIPLDGGASRGL